MLSRLVMENVGPVQRLEMEPAPRLNLLTGDNGLGKSFLLDVIWRALAGEWCGPPALARDEAQESRITFHTQHDPSKNFIPILKKINFNEPSFQTHSQNGLKIYFAINHQTFLQDPLKHGYLDLNFYSFNSQQLWDGYQAQNQILCNGLIRDWSSWQKEKSREFDLLCTALRWLSPSEREVFAPGKLTRISRTDARDIPTLVMPYGAEVPIVYASYGVQRILSLAYALVWTLSEHEKIASLSGARVQKKLVFLFDEVETHLHPRWQRSILHSFLGLIEEIKPSREMEVQVFAATHSPLVMASVEPWFDQAQDAWFDLNLEGEPGKQEVTLRKMPWSKKGDASAWLMSEAFDLQSAYSLEAEVAMQEASALMRRPDATAEDALKARARLGEVLGELDPFWVRWLYLGQKRGWWP